MGRKCSAPSDPASLREECLSAAEEAAQQVLNCIHPTLDSEEERRDIVEYVQRLIKSHLNCEVFPYGSVPLKTYLPDGDIDLTAINVNNTDESLAHKVLALLQREEKNVNAEFKIKDTQYIDAEVKLVKCLVRNTVIDMSFNQLGGLSTLCFLEQVDRLVGRNHLFKRSIILIKAWCYYESRILGAHHGLISTYALETLVLYIFHLYHSSLHGPLVVLYRFLEYYSKFDWENYCISLKGPVCKSSLPDIVVKVPEDGWTDLMFSQEFLENCMEMFSVSSRAFEGKSKAFQPKHLNIIDPLKENNNLGRSVHMGNFYRIQSALKYGTRKLGQILLLPFDKVADELRKFFSNAITRHGNDNRNSIQHLAIEFGDEESLSVLLPSLVKMISEDNVLRKSSVNDNDGVELESKDDGSLENGNFLKSELVDSASQKYGFKSWLEDSKEHAEVNNRYQRCIDSSQAICATDLGVTGANDVNDISLDSKDMDLTSMGEPEAFNPLADLSGDYDSHIRSLLYGQLCHGFSLSAIVHHPPSIPSWTKNKKPWNIVYQSMPFLWSQFSQMTIQPVPTEQSNCRAANSAPPAYGVCSEKQNARGSGPFLPHVNGYLGERNPPGRSSKRISGRRDQFNRHGQSNWSSGVKNNENGSHEMLLPEKGRSQHQRRLNEKSLSPGNETSGLRRIEFGSIGNLAEEVISASADIKGPTLGRNRTSVMKQERFAGKSIHLKNEAEFPPLC
ncbi:PAP/OAS1 substrate-binding domain superfamily [Perilla frutescens var. hirtella]|nr:PAP/OAS1 substrate-binding domain superfamily [Perilla frutescens var. hirtella]